MILRKQLRNKRALLSLAVLVCAVMLVTGCSAGSGSGGKKTEEAVYLGVVGYGDEDKNIDNKNKFTYRFFVGGKEEIYSIDNGEREADGVYAYPIQNVLEEGRIYDLIVEDGCVKRVIPLDDNNEWIVAGVIEDKNAETGTIVVSGRRLTVTEETGVYRITCAAGGASAEPAKVQVGDSARVVINSNGKAANLYLMPVTPPYTPPVSGKPGERTLLNYLRTAMMPVGSCLYVYGGGWNWQNTKAGRTAVTIGMPSSWADFFGTQTADYIFRKRNTEDPDDPQHSYFPYQHYNEYYYAGADCSGYLGWVIYNVLNTESGHDGYVLTSTETAKDYAEKYWGTYTRDLVKPANHDTSAFLPGDIVSISGHVWLCLGTCDDGSILILHSSPSDSRTGGHGGGVQLTALGESAECEAYRLADQYMAQFCPEWYARYEVMLKNYANYADMMSDINAGKFSWDVSGAGVITDPDGLRAMRPGEVLRMIMQPENP